MLNIKNNKQSIKYLGVFSFKTWYMITELDFQAQLIQLGSKNMMTCNTNNDNWNFISQLMILNDWSSYHLFFSPCIRTYK